MKKVLILVIGLLMVCAASSNMVNAKESSNDFTVDELIERGTDIRDNTRYDDEVYKWLADCKYYVYSEKPSNTNNLNSSIGSAESTSSAENKTFYINQILGYLKVAKKESNTYSRYDVEKSELSKIDTCINEGIKIRDSKDYDDTLYVWLSELQTLKLNYYIKYSFNSAIQSASSTQSNDNITYYINQIIGYLDSVKGLANPVDKIENSDDGKIDIEKEPNKDKSTNNETSTDKGYGNESRNTEDSHGGFGSFDNSSDSSGVTTEDQFTSYEWVLTANGWRCIRANGAIMFYMKSEWECIDGIWYYFDNSGYMAGNEYREGYWLDSSGAWNSSYSNGSWKCNSVGWWYEDNGWYPTSQWLKIDGYWYYFKADGYMASNQYVEGYWVGADGVCN